MDRYCKFCDDTYPIPSEHWAARTSRGKKTWRCRVAKRRAGARYRAKLKQDPIRVQYQKQYQATYHAKHPEVARYKAYVSEDKRKNREHDLDLEKARAIMTQPCHYCGVPKSGGIDRIDSSLGHLISNSVPCCEKCNFILGDLPYVAKKELKAGLESVYLLGLLDNWDIPTKRRTV